VTTRERIYSSLRFTGVICVIVLIFAAACIVYFVIGGRRVDIPQQIYELAQGLFLRVGLIYASGLCIIGFAIATLSGICSFLGQELIDRFIGPVMLRRFNVKAKDYKAFQATISPAVKNTRRKLYAFSIGAVVVVVVLFLIMAKDIKSLLPVGIICVAVLLSYSAFQLFWVIQNREAARLNMHTAKFHKILRVQQDLFLPNITSIFLTVLIMLLSVGRLWSTLSPWLNTLLANTFSEFVNNPVVQAFLEIPISPMEFPRLPSQLLEVSTLSVLILIFLVAILALLIFGILLPSRMIRRPSLHAVIIFFVSLGIFWGLSRVLEMVTGLILSWVGAGIALSIIMSLSRFLSGRYIESIWFKPQICQRCGYDNPHDSMFCGHCGKKLTRKSM
jgi:ribosomal protein L40E